MGLLDFSCKYLTYAFVSNGTWFKENSMIKADIEGYIVPSYCFYLFFCFVFSFSFFKFYFIFKLYIIVLVLPNIKMNPPQVYMCSPS